MSENAHPRALETEPAAELASCDGELRLRRAQPSDLAFIAGLIADPAVEPFLAAVTPSTRAELSEEIERGVASPAHAGRLVAEARAEAEWVGVGTVAYEVVNRRSRIAYLSALAVDPEHRGRGLGAKIGRLAVGYLVNEVGYHRVQCEIYAFNERALRVAEQAGFTREGARRRAYWRRGGWVDGILFGLLADELAD